MVNISDPQASLKKGMEWHMPGVDDNNPNNEDPGYIITSDRLEEIRGNKLYPFFDRGGGFGDNGDFQIAIRDTQPQINKQLNFLFNDCQKQKSCSCFSKKKKKKANLIGFVLF